MRQQSQGRRPHHGIPNMQSVHTASRRRTKAYEIQARAPNATQTELMIMRQACMVVSANRGSAPEAPEEVTGPRWGMAQCVGSRLSCQGRATAAVCHTPHATPSTCSRAGPSMSPTSRCVRPACLDQDTSGDRFPEVPRWPG